VTDRTARSKFDFTQRKNRVTRDYPSAIWGNVGQRSRSEWSANP